jgi:DNA (cytosine-5)-methyltransferase 1
MTHFSLFSGIGGLDLAAEMAGFKTVGQCEWADYPTKVLEKHWPDVPRWRDIRNVTAEGFYSKTGLRTITVISRGFPCQPFSTAGSRKGDKDDRYLWPEMLRVISELKPTWVIGENVGGLISMAQSDCEIKMETETAILKDFEMVLETIRRDFERIGYESQPILIPACAVGARHRRDRIFILGYSKHNGTPACENRGSTGTQYVSRRLEESESTAEKTGGESQGTGCISKDVADTHNNRLEKYRVEGSCNEIYKSRTSSEGSNVSTIREWWSIEPGICRVADGIPDRVDRLKCLGNAVVPQQAYPIFQAIADIEAGGE